MREERWTGVHNVLGSLPCRFCFSTLPQLTKLFPFPFPTLSSFFPSLAFLFTKVMTYPVEFSSLPPPNTRRLILALLDKNARGRPVAQAVLDDLLHGWQTFANAEADSAAAAHATTVDAVMDRRAPIRQHDHNDQHRFCSASAAGTAFDVDSTASTAAAHPAKRTCRRRSDACGQSATHTGTNDDAVVPLG